MQLKDDINQCFAPYQLGFRQKYSCEIALQFVLNDWRTAFRISKVSEAVLLDLERDF